MKIRVSFVGESLVLAYVNARPSLLELLLFGRTELDATAVAVPAPCGGRLWIWDATQQPIDSEPIRRALEAERDRLCKTAGAR